jgi:hypothetical protein
MPSDQFDRNWITDNAINVIAQYNPGELTIRALHYQLVGLGMTNTMQHYKRVVQAMEAARWNGSVDFEAFSDLDRSMCTDTKAEATDVYDSIETAKDQVKNWMEFYFKNRWENQPIYAEMFIEKKALQAVFQSVCEKNDIGLGAVKGYPSLTFLYEAAQRFIEKEREGKTCVILYFGDYDPSGEDIPRSIQANLSRMGAEVDVRRFALFEHQVKAWNLPPAPAKVTDSRTASWNGLGQVELDAVNPKQLKKMAQEAIDTVFDYDLFDALQQQQDDERVIYRKQLKDFVNSIE